MAFAMAVFVFCFTASLVRPRPAAASAPTNPHRYPLLKGTWNLDPSQGFFDLPRTAEELRSNGQWTEISNCNDKYNENFPGDRYIESPLSDDTDDIILIFDGAGYIAGIQMVTPLDHTFQDQYHNFTGSRYFQEGELLGRKVFFFTAYFVDPQIICQGGRSEWQFERQGTLHRLHIQTGPTSDNVISFPITENAMRNEPDFFEQNCFPTMGTHYAGTDESLPTHDDGCDITPPFSPIYNNGRMDAAALFSFARLSGRRMETLTAQSLFVTFNNPPQCLREAVKTPGVTTMHIFFDNYNADCSNRKSIIHTRGRTNN